jgi:hypothetical protein
VELGEEQAAAHHLVRHLAARPRRVDSGSEDGDRGAAFAEHGPMRGLVDAAREAGDDRDRRAPERGGEAGGLRLPISGWRPGADDRDARRPLEDPGVASEPQRLRRGLDPAQFHGPSR